MKKIAIMAALMASTSFAAPALAATPREAELEARLQALEAAMTELRADLASARSESAASSAKADAASGKVATWEAKAAKPEDGFKVGGTTIKLNGYFKAVASVSQFDHNGTPNLDVNNVARDFYLPGSIPVSGVKEGKKYEGNAKQTRLWLSTATPIGSHMLKGYLEFDFQTTPGSGQQRTTNGYNLAMRRAYMTYDNWLFGQEWSNFQYTAALPESTDFVGVTEGTIFVRQMQVRYTHKLSNEMTLSVAAENPETATAAAENKDDRVPDATIRLNYKPKFGEFSLAGIVRDLNVDTGAVHDSATGWGISFAGKVPFGADNRHDLRFMVTKGDGIGRYVGVNFSNDLVEGSGANAGTFKTTKVLAGFAAARVMLTDKLRTNLMASYQDVDYSTGYVGTNDNAQAWSVAGNLFYSPVKGFDLGVEYRHGEREVFSGASGQLDRLEFAAKYSF